MAEMAEKKADTRISGGIVVSGRGMQRADVLVEQGRVKSIVSPEDASAANQRIEASGRFVLPGIIDAHLHPVYSDRIDTLSRGAAAGGITTLIPFIGAIKAWGKGGDLYDAVEDFIVEGERDSIVDFGLHCSLCHDDMANIAAVLPRIVKRGVLSFKAFMAYAKRGMMLSDAELMTVMELIAAHKALFAVHAESGAMLDYLEDKCIAQGKVGPEFYYPTHPNIAEAEAVFRVLSLAQVTRCPMYLPHLSAWQALEVVRLFKQWEGPKPLFTETCVHYLTLTDADMKKIGSLAKVGPPLREEKDIQAMWRAVAEGLIDVVATDTAGHMLAKKEPRFGDVFKAPSGLPGIETLLTVMYDEGVNQGRITLPRLIEVLCENPARIFGLYPKKGALQAGSDADLVIFDPASVTEMRADMPLTKVDYSMFDGRRCLGTPELVMRRGEVIARNGNVPAEAGRGRYLPAAEIPLE
jgi:dihydropyrimidinase